MLTSNKREVLMLLVTRKVGQSVFLEVDGIEIKITVKRARGQKGREKIELVIKAPREVKIKWT